jgi:hypothetical protein
MQAIQIDNLNNSFVPFPKLEIGENETQSISSRLSLAQRMNLVDFNFEEGEPSQPP